MPRNEPGNIIGEYLTSVFGEQAFAEYLQYMQQGYTTTIRVNTTKISPPQLAQQLFVNYGISLTPHRYVPDAFELSEYNPILSKTLDHVVGNFYVQSTSSMIPPLVLQPKPGERVLDLCAAPGSKTTQIAALMNNSGTLIANEIASDRMKSLVFNLERCSVPNFATVHGKGEELSKLFPAYFDKILVDAPCSGLGILQRKGDDVSDWWSKDSVSRLQEIQYRLLVSAYKMLRPGGEMVYSTCTLTLEENEEVISKIIDKCRLTSVPIELPVPAVQPIEAFNDTVFNPAVQNGKRILPWQINSEGFFVIKLKKSADDLEEIPGNKRQQLGNDYKISKEVLAGVRRAFDFYGIRSDILEQYRLFFRGDDIYFVKAEAEFPLSAAFNRIGLKFADVDKYGNVLLHTQAIQHLKNEITIRKAELQDREDAVTYITGGTIRSITEPRGATAVSYCGYMLGAGKISDQGLKSALPRGVRTQAIQLPNNQ